MITINYLTHKPEREFFHLLTFYFLNKIKKANKKKINLNILITGSKNKDRWEKKAAEELEGIEFEVVPVPPGPYNYMNKIFYAARNSAKYAVKMDNDYFINNHIWDYMIENTHVLDDKDNLSLAPLSSTGIPTSELFVNNYFDTETIAEIHKTLLRAEFSPTWGYNYSHLNKFTLNADSWSGDDFYNATNSISYHYKGINPYRINSDCQNLINDKLLENLDNFVEKQDYKLTTLNQYFCNHCNMMLTSEWKKLIFDRSAYVDPYEEVPFNRYAVRNNKNFVFIERAFGIHIMFNTIYGEGNNPQRELDFARDLQKSCMTVEE